MSAAGVAGFARACAPLSHNVESEETVVTPSWCRAHGIDFAATQSITFVNASNVDTASVSVEQKCVVAARTEPVFTELPIDIKAGGGKRTGRVFR